jgi:membrane-bound lytic murein transglycosylase B
LIDAENAIRSAETPTDDVAEHARVQQAAYRQLVRTAEWRETVFSQLPAELQPVARANVEAGSDLRELTQPRTELPPWRIVAPPPADELRAHYAAGQKEFGIDWTYLAAIHLVETRMGRIRGTSIAGAKGPMQFLPSTWARWGKGDIENPRDAIHAAARYLRGHGAPADMDRALFAYNHSDLYVNAIKLYASLMRDEPRAYDAYYNWDVYYRTTKGDALLYVGWPDK